MKLFTTHKSEWVIVGIWLILLITNFSPNTYLTGWDSVQTDLSPLLGVKRAIFSVWEQYQSFGLPAGMGHAADLPRAITVLFLSFFLPQNTLRYVFHMGMILLAGLGTLKLLEFTGYTKEKKSYALLGSLFYIFNFAVIQMMYLPYESFSIFFGMLPWDIWAFLLVISSEKIIFKEKRTLFLFICVNILATGQNQAQQLFVVYMLLLGVIALGMLIARRSKILFINALTAAMLILAINAYWLMPQVYFLIANGSVVKEAKMNQLVTDDVFYSNKDKGTVFSFLSFTGFLYDRLNIAQLPIFLPWKAWRETVLLQILIASSAAVMLCGLLAKQKYKVGFLFAFFLIMVGLLLQTPPFAQINELLRNNPFINQIFRSPFTKFSIPFALVGAYFFTAGANFLIEHLTHFFKKETQKKYATRLALGAALLITLLIGFPAFTGNYLAKDMRVAIPKPYFAVMEYFHTIDPQKRVTLLPDYTFWGWFYTNWGYNGSGFLWYGIEQPVISRTFDVWSKPSESYYWEIKQAGESENEKQFEQVLQKYDVDYIIYDKSLDPIVSSAKAIQYDRLDNLLRKSPAIHLVKKFDFISVYAVLHPYAVKNFISVAKDVPNIGPKITITNDDTAFQTYGFYQTDPTSAYSVYYPFLDLTSQTRIPSKSWKLSMTANSFILSATVPSQITSYALSTKSATLTVNLYNHNKPVSFSVPYTLTLSGTTLAMQFPKTVVDTFSGNNAQIKPCEGSSDAISAQKTAGVSVTAKNGASACFGFYDQFLDQNYGYILDVKNTNVAGQRLFFYVLDQTKDQPAIEERLTSDDALYILGQKYHQGFGYNFAFQNTSYSTLPASNMLKEVSVYLLPYHSAKQFTMQSPYFKNILATTIAEIQSKEINYYTYVTTVPSGSNNTLILHQAYDSGWHAYSIDHPTFFSTIAPFLFGKPITNHVLINNWANGWNIPYNAKEQTILIFFWPQYLEYSGLGVIALLFIPALLLFYRSKKHHK